MMLVFFILAIISLYVYINLRDDTYDVLVTEKYIHNEVNNNTIHRIYIVIGEYGYGETKFIMRNKSDYDSIKVNNTYSFITGSHDYVVKEINEYTY